MLTISLFLSPSSVRVLCGAGLSNGTVDAAQQHDRTGALHTPRTALASAGGPFVIVLALPLCSSSLCLSFSRSLPHRSSLPPPSLPSRTLREVDSLPLASLRTVSFSLEGSVSSIRLDSCKRVRKILGCWGRIALLGPISTTGGQIYASGTRTVAVGNLTTLSNKIQLVTSVWWTRQISFALQGRLGQKYTSRKYEMPDMNAWLA